VPLICKNWYSSKGVLLGGYHSLCLLPDLLPCMQVIQESLANLQAATAANVLGSGVLSSLQLGPDFSMRLPSLNLCNQNSCSSTPPGTKQQQSSIKATSSGGADDARHSTNTASSGGVAENAAAVANGAHGELVVQEATLAAVNVLSAAAADAAAGTSAKRSSGNGSLKSGTRLDAVEPAPTNMSDDTVAVC
jgi:hypothetical protein